MSDTPAACVDVNAIDPRNGAKYSPNLHRWLTTQRQARHLDRMRVYRHRDGSLFVGFVYDGDFIGAQLMRVLVAGVKADMFCHPDGHRFAEVPGFWEHYASIGRCAVDPEHKGWFMGDDTRWRTDGDTRHCLWCGNARQVLRRWSEAVQREAWESDAGLEMPPPAGAADSPRPPPGKSGR